MSKKIEQKKMKKHKILILLTAVLVSGFQISFGQIWCPAGANWTYYSSGGGYYSGIVVLTYSGDTIINSINCKKLKKTRDGQYVNSPFTFFHEELGTEITYEQDSVVYIRTGNNFDTLYNFKASIGDCWKMMRSSLVCDDSTSNVTVLDTGMIIINSIPLKFLAVNLHYSNTFPNDRQDTIIEKIGFMSSYYIASDWCSAVVDGDEGGSFQCYSDDNFTYKANWATTCSFIVGINGPQKEVLINIYPNPVNNNIYIESKEHKLTYVIYSIDNRLIKEGLIDAKQINCEELLNGIYILTIKGENNFLQHFKILKESSC